MKKNMGTIDRAIRVILAIVVAVLYFMNAITGTVAIILGVFAIIFIITSFIGFYQYYNP